MTGNSFLLGLVITAMLLVSVPASAASEEYILGIFGNANEDDTINMEDVEYTELIILEYRDRTDLADAKYDGGINILDVTQIELIILGRENELTIVQHLGKPPDITEEPVTVPMPIESIAALGGSFGPYTVCAMGEADKIVAVVDSAKDRGEIRELIEDVPEVGKSTVWDMEMILELNPDIVLAYASYGDYSYYEETLNVAGIPLVQMDFHVWEKYSKELSNLGWMLNKQERAEELISFEQQHLGIIEERVKNLDEEQKPRVYCASYPGNYGEPTHTSGKGSSEHDLIEFCGGINIFADLEGTVVVDPEEVIIRNPQVIYATTTAWYPGCPLGYDITDTSPVEEFRQDMIMDYPGWDHIDAVKDGRVYFISTDAKSTHPSVYQSYLAKWFHPEVFEDIDPVAIHREWMETFLGIEYEGVYAYPTYPVS